MPIQIWTPIQSYGEQGTRALALGIADAGRSIGAGIGGIAERMKRQQEEEKRKLEETKQLRSMAKLLTKQLDMSPLEIEQADAATIAGRLRGHLVLEDSGVKQLQKERDVLAIAELKRRAQEAEAQARVPGMMLQPPPRFEPETEEAGTALPPHPDDIPAGLRQILQAHAQAGAAIPPGVMDDLVRQMGREQFTMPPLPPGFQPKSMTVGPGGVSQTFGEPATDKPEVVVPPELNVLITTEDKDQFTRGIQRLSPELFKAVLERRALYNRAIGRDDPLREALALFMRGMAPPSNAPPGNAPAPGGKGEVKRWKFNPQTGNLE